MSVTHVTGVMLAGGQSRRMGQNKALMTFQGQRLIDRVVEVLQRVFTQCLMVTNTPELYTELALPMVPDVFPDKGSLGGIYSAIYHAPTSHCLVVACDMPFLNVALLRYLVDHIQDYDVVVPDMHNELQPLHAIYSKACLQPIAQRLAADRLKIVGFFPDVRVRTVTAEEVQTFDPEGLSFENLNTPEEFHAATQRQQVHGS